MDVSKLTDQELAEIANPDGKAIEAMIRQRDAAVAELEQRKWLRENKRQTQERMKQAQADDPGGELDEKDRARVSAAFTALRSELGGLQRANALRAFLQLIEYIILKDRWRAAARVLLHSWRGHFARGFEYRCSITLQNRDLADVDRKHNWYAGGEPLPKS